MWLEEHSDAASPEAAFFAAIYKKAANLRGCGKLAHPSGFEPTTYRLGAIPNAHRPVLRCFASFIELPGGAEANLAAERDADAPSAGDQQDGEPTP